MLHKTLTIAFTLLTITCLGQKKQKVDLDWKIGKNEKLSYSTVMTAVDTASTEKNIDDLFKPYSEKTAADVKKLIRNLRSAFKNTELISTLTNKNGIIDIVITAKLDPEKQPTDTTGKEPGIEEITRILKQKALIRGSVHESGAIHSFWQTSKQKNYIALLFELPEKPVQIGDSWSLEVNLITSDQNFICDSAYRKNTVTLVDIKKQNNESIAVLEYNISEYIKGNYSMPNFDGKSAKQIESFVKFNHYAIAEFSIDNGRWVSYDGIQSMESTGAMNSKEKVKFTLKKI